MLLKKPDLPIHVLYMISFDKQQQLYQMYKLKKKDYFELLLPYPIEKIIYKIYDLRIGPQIITSQEDSHAAYIFH